MNLAMDVLKLRRVRLDYVSPPVCPMLMSASGSSIFLEDIAGVQPPTNLRFAGQCSKFLVWDNAPGTFCVSLYKAVDSGNITGAYQSEIDCINPGIVVVTSPGWWSIAIVNSAGQETFRSDPVQLAALGSSLQLTLPSSASCDIASFVLYKNPDPTNVAGNYADVLSFSSNGVIEIPDDSGCYRLQAITDSGASNLSTPICRNTISGCCPPEPCPTDYRWDPDLCSCSPDSFASITGASNRFCVGIPYASSFGTVGGTAPFVWALVSGTPPPGVTFHAGTQAGTTAPIDGIPIASGSYTFTIRGTDFGAKSILYTTTFVGLDVNQYALFSGTFYTDTAFSKQLTTTGGTAPYVFSVTSGALPGGLTMTSLGLISGTPLFDGVFPFSVTVTDSQGVVCVVTLSLTISPCPTVVTYPSIAQWGSGGDGQHGPQANINYGAFDSARRVWWLPRSDTFTVPGPPFQVVSLISTASRSLLGYATDLGGHISSGAFGDTSNGMGRCVIDTKYNQCVVGGNQGYYAWYDLTTKNCLAVTVISGLPITQFLSTYPAYDPVRGYIYMAQSTTGGALTIQVLDCNPAIRGVIGNYVNGSFSGGPATYCPDNDTVYITNTAGGTHPLHKWNPTTHAFTTQVPAAISSSGTNLRYLPGIKLIAVDNGINSVFFIDPNASDGFVGGTNLTNYNYIEYDPCNGKIYIDSGSFNGVHRIDPLAGFTQVAVPGFAGSHYNAMVADQDSNRVFAVSTAWQIDTGV